MNNRRQLHCVFYSNVLDIYQLDSVNICKLNSHIFVELAEVSNLAAVFNRQYKREIGLAALFPSNANLNKLGRRIKNVSAPLILASNRPLSASVNVSTIDLLASVKGTYDQVTFLVHIDDAPKFINAYDYMDEFSIVWDIADYPNHSLQKLAGILTDNRHFNKQSWGGFHLVNHHGEALPGDSERELALRSVIDEFTALQIVA